MYKDNLEDEILAPALRDRGREADSGSSGGPSIRSCRKIKGMGEEEDRAIPISFLSASLFSLRQPVVVLVGMIDTLDLPEIGEGDMGRHTLHTVGERGEETETERKKDRRLTGEKTHGKN